MKRILTYCFYDRYGIADDYVFYFLDKIQPYCSEICIVVNGRLAVDTEKQFKKYTDKILKRENIGFDSGAFKHAINTLGIDYFKQFDEAIFANDTFYGPLFSLDELFNRMENDNNIDFWGVTKHPEIDTKIANIKVCEHLQSYFLAFKNKILSSQDFNEYWDNMLPAKNYDEAIAFYELYTTSFFTKRGYNLGSFIDINLDIFKSCKPYFYETCDLIEQRHLPFVKKKIFQPDNLNNLRLKHPIKNGGAALLKLINQQTDYNVNLIFDNIARTYPDLLSKSNKKTLIISLFYSSLKILLIPWKYKHYSEKINQIRDKIDVINFITKERRILLVSHDLSITGAPMVLLWLAKFLIQLKYKVDVVAFRKNLTKNLYDKFCEIGIKPELINNKRGEIYKYCSANLKHYNLIICNTIETYKFINIAQKFKKNVVWYIHETKLIEDYIKHPDQFKNFRTIFQNCKNIYTVSEYAAKTAKKYNNFVKIIPNGMEDFFEKYFFNKDNITFGFIGTINPIKGIGMLTDTFMELSPKYPNIKLIIAGEKDNPYAEKLIYKTKENNSICWLGNVTGYNKREFFNQIDVLCVPSLDDPCPLTILEGTMLGKAIITTESTGNNYLVKNCESGFIIPTENKNALFNAMEYFCLNPEKIENMQHESRNMYLEFGTIRTQEIAIKELLKKYF